MFIILKFVLKFVLFSRQIMKNGSFKFKELAFSITLEKSLKKKNLEK